MFLEKKIGILVSVLPYGLLTKDVTTRTRVSQEASEVDAT